MSSTLLADQPTIDEIWGGHWPDHTELPEEDGSIVHNFQEHPQAALLSDCIKPILAKLHPDGRRAIGQDCGIYWRRDLEDPLRGCIAPDWYYVPNVDPLLNDQVRRSYVIWQELIAPTIVLEFVSGDGRKERDATPNTGKFWVYETVIRPAYYGIYEVDPGHIELYTLVDTHYALVLPNQHGHYPIKPLGIALGIWNGKFDDVTLPWMR